MRTQNTTTGAGNITAAQTVPTVQWIGDMAHNDCPLNADELITILWEVSQDFIDCPAIDRADIWIGRDETSWGYTKLGEEFLRKFPTKVRFTVTRNADLIDLANYIVEKLGESLDMALAINRCVGARSPRTSDDGPDGETWGEYVRRRDNRNA